jgi:hypothetical protein
VVPSARSDRGSLLLAAVQVIAAGHFKISQKDSRVRYMAEAGKQGPDLKARFSEYSDGEVKLDRVFDRARV